MAATSCNDLSGDLGRAKVRSYCCRCGTECPVLGENVAGPCPKCDVFRVEDAPAKALAALVKERGALVSSADCSTIEIACARACGRFFVTDDGLGYVLRPRKWREKAESEAE